jgi:hypothetical protein
MLMLNESITKGRIKEMVVLISDQMPYKEASSPLARMGS